MTPRALALAGLLTLAAPTLPTPEGYWLFRPGLHGLDLVGFAEYDAAANRVDLYTLNGRRVGIGPAGLLDWLQAIGYHVLPRRREPVRSLTVSP